MLKYVVLIMLALLFGCSAFRTPQENEIRMRERFPSIKMNDITIGMNREDVIQLLGQPSSTSAINNTIYLNYKLRTPYVSDHIPLYFVRLIDGKVESFGKMGDFDSAKVPEKKTTIDLNIKNTDSK